MTPLGTDFAALVDRERLIERLSGLVQRASENPPGDEAAAAELVASYCDDLDLDVSRHAVEPTRPSIIARRRWGDGPTLCYCSHIDVVPAGDRELWDVEPYAATIADGHMHGRGTADAKGPIAAALEAVAILDRAKLPLAGTLELALVSDEETMGFKGAGFLVEEQILKPDLGIVGEPTSLRVVRAQRGACWLRITTRGVAAHGSAPERGVSAIRHMSEIIRHLEENLPEVSHPLLGGPTINVGTIAGGEKVNIVPALCSVEVDRRTIPQESTDDVIASVERAVEVARQRFPDLDASVELSFNARPFEIDEGSALVQRTLDAATEALGRPAEIMGFRGASDARFLADAGAEVVVFGPGDIAVAHTARESIELEELERAAVAYAAAFARLLAS